MGKFQERLREIRGTELQDEFAAKIGISRTSLSYYENGNRIPDIDTLTRIHETTGVSIYYLLGLSDSKDDALATAQKDTGLSEETLLHFTNNPISAKVINHLVACHAMKSFSKRAAILHDDTLLTEKFRQREWSEVAKILRDTELQTTERRMHAILSSAFINSAFMSPSFGIDTDLLPSNALCKLVEDIKTVWNTLDAMSPTMAEAAAVKKQYGDVLDRLITRKEATDAQETPES